MTAKKNILITGGSGYIGSCLVSLLSKKYSISIIDKNRKSKFLKNNKFFLLDLKNKKKLHKLLKLVKPEFVIHLAGQSTIDMVEINKKDYFSNNYTATKNLIECMEKLKIPNLIFSSTAAVYKKQNREINENTKIYSNNSYGVSKIKCENIIKKINPKITKFCILRFFNVASSVTKNNIGEFHSPETHLIPLIINSLFKRKTINVYGNNYPTIDGTCLRDYIHILDILRGIEKSITYLSKKNSRSNIFNLGSGKCYSVQEIINCAIRITKLNTKIIYKKKRKYDASKLSCDIKKAGRVLGWKPLHSNIKKIIKDEISWYKYLNKNKYFRKYIY